MASERVYSPSVFQRRMRRPRSSSSSDISGITESSESSVDLDSGPFLARPRSSMGVRIASPSSSEDDSPMIKYHERERLEQLLRGIEDIDAHLGSFKATPARVFAPRAPSRAMEPLSDEAAERMANFTFPPPQSQQTPLAPPHRILTPLSPLEVPVAEVESGPEPIADPRFNEPLHEPLDEGARIAGIPTGRTSNTVGQTGMELLAQLRPRTNITPNGTPNFRATNTLTQISPAGWPRSHAGEHAMFSPYTPPQLSPGTPMFMWPTHSPYGQPIAPPSSAHQYFTGAEYWQQLPPHLRNPAPYSRPGPPPGPIRIDPRSFPGHPGYQPGLSWSWIMVDGYIRPGPPLQQMSPPVPTSMPHPGSGFFQPLQQQYPPQFPDPFPNYPSGGHGTEIVPRIVPSPPTPSWATRTPSQSQAQTHTQFGDILGLLGPFGRSPATNPPPLASLPTTPTGAHTPSSSVGPSTPNSSASKSKKRLPAFESKCYDSPLLRLFKATAKDVRDGWKLDNIKGHVLPFVMDQHGCVWLEAKLKELYATHNEARPAFQNEYDWVFTELQGHMFKMACNAYGNFIAQPFYKLCSDVQRNFMLAELQPWVSFLSKDKFGCRVLQTILQSGGAAAQASITEGMERDIVSICNDEFGNHVVQMALKAVPVDRLQFSDTMVCDIKQIIVAKYGCKVVMEAIHALSPTDVNLIVDMMANNSMEIINDGHANYVWQYIVRLGTPEQRRILISRLMGNFASYSMSHISSWCCQKALEHADVDQRRALILELFDLDHRQLGHLAEHKNGSHVFVTALKMVDGIGFPGEKFEVAYIKLGQLRYRNITKEAKEQLETVIPKLW